MSEVLRSVIVIFHIGDRDNAAKIDLFARLTILGRVRVNIPWPNVHISWVLIIHIVLLDLNEISHVTVRCCVESFLNVALRSKRFLVALSDLICAILLPY